MTDETRPALGLSVGATNFAAVTADRAVTRKPVLTLYRQRPPEVGVPSENSRLDEPGLVITDFVNRVGDPGGIVATDGSAHRSEALVADGLRALAYTATGGRALPDTVVTYPAHWRSAAVDALHGALNRVSEWSSGGLSLLSDAAAALVALQANPGVPARGIIAVCDFGGTGTSITLVDAANDYQPVAPTVRHADFSGDLIDQMLLNRVVADLSTAGSLDTSATSAIGSLNRLRAECRTAKEQLSSNAAITLTGELPGFPGDLRLTRTDLDDAIRQPLDAFVAAVQEALRRSGIRVTDLVGVASVGGGASIPAVTATLSEHFPVPVITAPRPHLTPAIGAALRAAHGPAGNSETALAPTAAAFMPPTEAVTTSAADLESSSEPALAWSEAGDDSGIMPVGTGEYFGSADDAWAPQPPQPVVREAGPAEARPAAVAWYRRPAVLIAGTTLLVLVVGAAVVIDLLRTSGGGPTAPTPSVSTAPVPGSSAPATESSGDTNAPPTPGTSQPSTASSTTQPPSSTQTTTTEAPTTTPPTTTETPTTTQPTTTQATTPPQPVPPEGPRLPRIPRLIPPPGTPGG